MKVLFESARKIGGTAISALDSDRFHGEIRSHQEFSGGRQSPFFCIFPNAQSLGNFEQSSCIGGRNIKLEFSARVVETPTDATVTTVDKVCQFRNSLIAVDPRHGRAWKQAAQKVIKGALVPDCRRFIIHGNELSGQNVVVDLVHLVSARLGL